MQTFELLDRFELMYPTNNKLGDLRRLYIDKDLSSLFRLIPNEELRKAIVEQNLHSIFRVLGEGEDSNLRKLILEDNTWKLWPLLHDHCNTQFIEAFKYFTMNEIEIDNDCFSRGQIQSKKWLVTELQKCNLELGIVYLCAGWYATLATMLFESGMKVDKIRSFDIDPSCMEIAEVFNKPWFVDKWRFKAVTKDIMHITYDEHWWESWSNANNRMSKPILDIPDTIINTSCEHIEDFDDWYNKIPVGKLLVLQTNDYFEIEDHINCSESLAHFAEATPMSNVLYEGELHLEHYTRYMRIGYR